MNTGIETISDTDLDTVAGGCDESSSEDSTPGAPLVPGTPVEDTSDY